MNADSNTLGDKPDPFADDEQTISFDEPSGVNSSLFEDEAVVSAETPDDLEDEKTVYTPPSIESSYKFSGSDVGLTFDEVRDRLKKIRKPNDLDRKILDALMFDGGAYEETFTVGNFSFALRSVSTRSFQNSLIVLRKVDKEYQGLVGENAMSVARMLCRVNDEPTCEYTSQKEFESQKAIAARYDRTMTLPVPIFDVVVEKLNTFVGRTREAVRVMAAAPDF